MNKWIKIVRNNYGICTICTLFVKCTLPKVSNRYKYNNATRIREHQPLYQIQNESKTPIMNHVDKLQKSTRRRASYSWSIYPFYQLHYSHCSYLSIKTSFGICFISKQWSPRVLLAREYRYSLTYNQRTIYRWEPSLINLKRSCLLPESIVLMPFPGLKLNLFNQLFVL